MLFANINGIKSLASPKSKAVCDFCGKSVIAKCGKIKTWHWAHKSIDACDTWYEPETEWHLNWKLVFGKEYSEVILIKDGEKHIADIKTNNGYVIEVQNSKLPIEKMEARERFYGRKMFWVINGIKFKDNFKIFTPGALHDNLYDEYSPELEYFSKMHGFTLNYRPTQETIIDLLFDWKYSHSVWRASNRKIYIDFGTDKLYLITSFMGNSKGKVIEISKNEFVKTHGGNLDLVHKLILNYEGDPQSTDN